ncbi:MAG: sel1 repeat family protein, partial [Pseudomonadales bacterium]|nr:sel1 repeat family protein [Pseudomonadales bacterium]
MRGLIILSLMLASSFAGAATTSAFEEAAELYRSQQFLEAKAAFTRLADQGSARASAILGMMSRFGEGGPVDLQKAYDFYLEAARAGHPPA